MPITHLVSGFEVDSSEPDRKVDKAFDRYNFGTNALTCGAVATSANVGAKNGATVSAVEGGADPVHRTVFTLTDLVIAMTDAGEAGCHGGVKIYDFPGGLVSILGAVVDLTVAAGEGGISDTAALIMALGTAASGTDNEALSGAEADFVPSTACALTGGAGVFKGVSTTSQLVQFDGTATAKDLFLNAVVPNADSSADDTLTVSGTITVVWVFVADK